MVVESEKLRENLQTKVSQNIYQISRPCFSKFSDKRKQEKKIIKQLSCIIKEIKHQYHEPQRFLKQHLITQKRRAISQNSGRNKPTRLFSYEDRNRNDRR